MQLNEAVDCGRQTEPCADHGRLWTDGYQRVRQHRIRRKERPNQDLGVTVLSGVESLVEERSQGSQKDLKWSMPTVLERQSDKEAGGDATGIIHRVSTHSRWPTLEKLLEDQHGGD